MTDERIPRKNEPLTSKDAVELGWQQTVCWCVTLLAVLIGFLTYINLKFDADLQKVKIAAGCTVTR